MKTTPTQWLSKLLMLVLGALLVAGCAKATLPVDIQLQLPIDFLFKDGGGTSKANLLGTDIAYLGSAAKGSVYAGAREENASLVVVRWNGQDNFYSLKGLMISNLQQVLCRVDCDILVSLVEGADVLIEIRTIDITNVLTTPKVVWQNPGLPAPTTGTPAPTLAAGQATPNAQQSPNGGPFECKYLAFKKGGHALTLVPLKMRSSPELPENFNSNVISYMQAGEKVEVLADSQGEWVNIKKESGETGYSKQCTTLNGRFLQPGD